MWLADLFSSAREQQFLNLLKQHSSLLALAAKKLHEYVERGSPQLPDEIAAIERQADDALTQLNTALRDAFVTPIDRQDIYNLSEAVDDMIDYLDNAASEIALFKVPFTEHMLAMTAALQRAAEAIDAAVATLKSQPQEAWSKARQASNSENDIEDHYRHALLELFADADMGKIFKLREVYRHLSNSGDRADAIGRLIGKIVVKAT